MFFFLMSDDNDRKIINCRIFDPFTEIPADVLLFQICIPFAIEHFKPRVMIKALLRQWFTAVGWALGLTDFLLPRPEDNNGPENGELARRDRLHDARQGGHVQQEWPPIALVAADNERRGHAFANADVEEESDVDDQADSG